MSHDHEISCEEVIERLFAYLDGELEDVSPETIDHHLAHCRDCFTRAEFEKRLRARVADSVSTSAPERLRSRVRALLDEF